jgi:anti-anti-sigma factor
MPLKVRVEEGRSLTKTLFLEGRLDNESVATLDEELEAVLGSAVKVVVLDLTGLEYITSAGLRSIFRAQKVMNARSGKAVLLNPQPQVQKVLDMV